MSEKFKIFLGFVIAAVGIATAFVWLSNTGFELGAVAPFSVILIIVGLAAWVLMRRASAVKAGLPAEDELSKKVMHKAGYYAFLTTIYIALFVGMFEEDIAGFFGLPELEVHSATGLIILLSAVSFMASFFILSRRGSVE
jgi:hypothetical protein